MPSSSPVSSTAASKTVYSEEVTNQALMSAIMDLRAQLTSLSHRQDWLMELITGLLHEFNARTEPPAPAPVRRIGREPAFYHLSNEEEAPWKAPGGYHPYRDGVPPARGEPTTERPAYPSSLPLHPPVSRQRVLDPYDESSRLAPLRSSGSQSPSSLPRAQGVPTLPPIESILGLPPLNIQPAPTPRARPLRREPAFYHISPIAGAPFVAPGPGIFQPPPYPPTTAPTTPAAPLPSPKRKREDAWDEIDEPASDKKRPRCPSADDVD